MRRIVMFNRVTADGSRAHAAFTDLLHTEGIEYA